MASPTSPTSRPPRTTTRTAGEIAFDAAPASERPPLGDALPIRIPHPVRRLFGESRGVTWAVCGILLILVLLLVRPMAMSLLSWHRTAAMLDERRTEVEQLERRNTELQEQVAYFTTELYIVEQARLYGMVAPGERGFVLRELAHPELTGRFAMSRLRNATTAHPAVTAPPVANDAAAAGATTAAAPAE